MNRNMRCLEMHKLRILRFMVPVHARNERGLSMNLEIGAPVSDVTDPRSARARRHAHDQTVANRAAGRRAVENENARGVPEISRGLRRAATTPPGYASR
jgi:hypothetical protein